MAAIRVPRGWEFPEREATPEHVYWNRRRFLTTLGTAAIGASGFFRHAAAADSPFPAKRNPKYQLDRPITAEGPVTHYNNFYEFTEKKEVWKLVDRFKTEPWTIKISGRVEKPQTLDLDKLRHWIPLEERLYRHRCVEAWAMAVPWTGIPLKALIELAEPKADARYVRLVSFFRPNQAPNQKEPQWTETEQGSRKWYPWPYYEALTMAEAMNELTFVATGIYGHELPKQNGAPLRLVVPWKYGFKSIKSIVRIELTSKKPGTFWNDFAPLGNDWFANVNPAIPHPEWSQATEKLIDTGEVRPTVLYNGYGSFVAHLYEKG